MSNGIKKDWFDLIVKGLAVLGLLTVLLTPFRSEFTIDLAGKIYERKYAFWFVSVDHEVRPASDAERFKDGPDSPAWRIKDDKGVWQNYDPSPGERSEEDPGFGSRRR